MGWPTPSATRHGLYDSVDGVGGGGGTQGLGAGLISEAAISGAVTANLATELIRWSLWPPDFSLQVPVVNTPGIGFD
jgi:hypothetical protein